MYFDDDLEPRSPLKLPTPQDKRYPTSDFSHPQKNSSGLIQKRLEEIKRKLEDDEISIPTVVTTSTDRHVATKIVQKLQEDSLQRYKNLPVESKTQSTQQLKKIGKQIDPNWLFRRQNCGPSTEDKQIFYPGDPSIRLHFDKARQRKSLLSVVDLSYQSPSYEFTVEFNDILGESKDKVFNTNDDVETLVAQNWFERMRNF